ncbi:MAG: GNAT family N-acetyltransferase [Deltaproteobacteria bacterium]|jgi:ribosomal protein S18 acetylase RimI-like enzyme|nr:GNAT family N-acetyltransferase [Deltaproteobacteria bacterium]MBW2533471.1 GNAT family N-acetyltransferase [Deltaproteobacteria bacterium]
MASPPRSQSDPATLSEQLDFVERYPTRPLDRQTASWLIERLGAPQERLLDVVGPNGRQLLAMVFANMRNPDEAAELWILGYRGDANGPDAVARAVVWAKAKAAAAGARCLDLTLPAALQTLAPRLRAEGFEWVYDNYTMVLESIATTSLVQTPTPPDLRWTELGHDLAASAYECYAAGFAEVSGAQIPSLDTFRATVLTAEIKPRILLEGSRVVAIARVVLLDAAAGRGEIRSIARHPSARGRGLGKLLLAEALRTLIGSGATEACLEVASDNAAAIGLYEQSGFETRETTAVYRSRL